MDEMVEQTMSIINSKKVSSENFTKQIAFNAIPHIDVFAEDGYTKEELKMTRETKKILDDKIELTATCVRIPVKVSHAESVNIEFEKPFTVKKISETLNNSPGCKVFDKRENAGYITPVDAEGKNETFVSRIREDNSKNNGFLVVHLRMTGYFKFIENSSHPCKHTRIRFFDKNNNELRYVDVRSFGQMWWINKGLSLNKIIKGLGSLGPEPFSKDFDANYLKKVISNRTKSIKSVLLDQTIVAGIGNIYADESLYSAGISPFREAHTIKKNELIKLKESIVTVLKKSIGSGGTTFSDFRDLEGENGNFGLQTNVYRRTGKKCRKCGNLIEKQKIAGRSTHWCPNCQK